MRTSGGLSGMRGWIAVVIGQFLSVLGTGVSQFGLAIWAFEQTGQATTVTLFGFFFMTPLLVFSPIAGALVDRYDRKLMAMLSDLASGLVTIATFGLLMTGLLQIWHLYVGAAIVGLFSAFQWPAFSAAMSLMVPKEQLTRANSLLELAFNGSQVLAPMIAAALIAPIGLQGLLLIDIVSFSFAIGALLLITVPPAPRSEAGAEGQGSLLREALYGFQYMWKRPSLVMLQSIFMVGNFFTNAGFALLVPFILARTGGNELALGSVQSIGAIGGVAGAAIISAWGGFRKRIHGVLIGWALSLVTMGLMGLGRPGLMVPAIAIWSVVMFLHQLGGPLVNASNQAIWQSKVAPDVQGRVFSTRRLVAWLVIPLANLIAGPLADRVMEPAMQTGGSLASTLGWLAGTGPGAGMGLILFAFGVIGTLASLGGYLIPQVRNVESILPDFDGAGVEQPASSSHGAEVAAAEASPG